MEIIQFGGFLVIEIILIAWTQDDLHSILPFFVWMETVLDVISTSLFATVVYLEGVLEKALIAERLFS